MPLPRGRESTNVTEETVRANSKEAKKEAGKTGDYCKNTGEKRE